MNPPMTRDLDTLMRSADLIALLGWGDKRPVANIDGGEYAGPCPRCGGRDRCRCWPYSERPRFWCRGCNWSGRAVDLVMELHDVGFREALDILEGTGSWAAVPRARAEAHVAPERTLAPDAGALALWESCGPAAGTLADAYLRGRGITIPLPESLRFHASLWHSKTGIHRPALVAAVEREARGIVAVHRTYLTPEGKKASHGAKMMLGSVWGAAVRLSSAGETLAVAEGIETALSVQQETGLPTWAALSAGGFDSLILPAAPLASRVVVAADNDAAGLRHAYDAAERWTADGREVRVIFPDTPGDDFNDLLMRGAR